MPYKTPELRRKNYLENKEKQLKQSSEWAKSHPESRRSSYRKWAAANPDKVKGNKKSYDDTHKEKTSKYGKQYRKDHPEEVKAALDKWRKENAVARRIHQHTRKTRKTEAGGTYTVAEWTILCKKYGYKCLWCDKRRKLTADHVIPVSKGGTSNIDNIQPLCGPCNSRKGAKIVDFRV